MFEKRERVQENNVRLWKSVRQEIFTERCERGKVMRLSVKGGRLYGKNHCEKKDVCEKREGVSE